MKMPAVFFGHGSPMNALESNKFTQSWVEVANYTPRPLAIVSISAHWETSGVNITNNKKMRTIHDFGAFPDELFKIQYSPDGSYSICDRIQKLIPESKINPNWGLDHGTWSILRHMYPKADIPTVQLSLDQTKSPIDHYRIAKRLRKLREEGILIMGSGNIVHNLSQINWANDAKPYEWALKFDTAVKHAILCKEHEKIIEYQNLDGAKESVPTPEHLLPLLYILAQQDDHERAILFSNDIIHGSISMTSVFIN